MAAPIHLVMAARMDREVPRHECPIGGCRISLPPSKLMCRAHWFSAPKPYRDAVNDAYNHGAGVGSLKLLHAQQAAIEAVERDLEDRA